MTTSTVTAPRTVEVRIPAGTTATGQSKTWAKIVNACSLKAKTGYDYEGDFINDGCLHDLPQGTLVLVGGSQGSRKNNYKVADLYCAVDEGLLIRVNSGKGNEWAVDLRDTTCDHLALGWIERCRRVLEDEIIFQEQQTPKPSHKLALIREAAKEEFVRTHMYYAAFHDAWNYVNEAQSKVIDTWLPGEVAKCQQKLDQLEAEYQKSVTEHAAYVEELKDMLNSFTPAEEAAPVERSEVVAARTTLMSLTREERVALMAEFGG